MKLLDQTQAAPLARRSDGTIHVTGSRVTLDTIVACYDQGDSPEEIVEAYPSLTLEQVYGVIAFLLGHRGEVKSYLRQREKQARSVRAKIERGFPTTALRAKLLARAAGKSVASHAGAAGR